MLSEALPTAEKPPLIIQYQCPLCSKSVPGAMLRLSPAGTVMSPTTKYVPGPRVPERVPLSCGWARTGDSNPSRRMKANEYFMITSRVKETVMTDPFRGDI
jgi:hypothetical protein